MVSSSPPLQALTRFCSQLIRVEWLLLLAILPVVLFSDLGGAVALLLVPVLWSARKVATGHFVTPTPLDLSILLLGLMILVSVYAAPDPAFSRPKVVALLYSIGVFYAVGARTGENVRAMRWGAPAFLGAGVLVAIAGLLSADWPAKLFLVAGLAPHLPDQLLRLPGAELGVHANELAGILLWFLPLALVLAVYYTVALWRGERRLRQLLPVVALWAISLFMAGVLVLAQSRGALLAFALTLFFLLLTAIRRRRRLAGLLLLVAGVATALLVWAGPERILTALVDPVTNSETLGTTLSETTFELRQQIWQRAYYAIGDFPLTGMGMNSFRRVAPILYPFFTDYFVRDIAHAHNQLLQTALDLGIPGVVAYLAIWLGSAVMLWQSWRRTADGRLRALALGMAASLLAFSIYGLTDAVALGARPQFLFWVLLGLVAGLHRLVRKTPQVQDGLSGSEPVS